MLKAEMYLNLLASMKAVGLATSLIETYCEDQLKTCCERLKANPFETTPSTSYRNMQAAMVENPDLIERVRELLAGNVSEYSIDEWLKEEKQTGCAMIDRAADVLIPLFTCAFPSMQARQEYALYFLPVYTDSAVRETVIDNIRQFYMQMPRNFAAMSETERDLFTHAFLSDYLSGVDSDTFIPMLSQNICIVRLLDFLFAKGVDCSFSNSGFMRLNGLTDQMVRIFEQIFDVLGGSPDRMERFMMIWLDNGGLADDMNVFHRKAAAMTPEQQDKALETRLSYLSALYGNAVGNLPFQQIGGNAFPVVAYAITHRQHAFLRLIEANFELFQSLPYNCMLFSSAFYTRVRLNSITLKNLRDCLESIYGKRDADMELLTRREYTFEEMKTLCDARREYLIFYNSLHIERTDDRLLVLRQMLKRDLLHRIDDERLAAVAARLSEKPFTAWKDEVFSHIRGMIPALCVRLLCVYENISRFIPEIHTANEASFLLRHNDRLEAYSDWKAIRENIEQIDTAWVELRKALQLDDAFAHEHEQDIMDFLCGEGASIALTYLRSTAGQKGFEHIVRAQLMGKYAEVKYHADDLVKEIGYPVTDEQKAVWMNNTAIGQGKTLAEERDDFFTTMRIGELPQRTCLNYADGAYRECLLACFDSNKKFLYATMGGRPVARAMLRLTKGCAKKPEDDKTASLRFADLRSDDHAPTERVKEKLVLFLERMYSSWIGSEEEHQIRRMFITLAVKKAQEIGAEVVLSSGYREDAADMGFTAMRHYLYISKSKGGKQYLDSLGGSCNVTSEGSYKQELVMMLPTNEQSEED